MISDAPVETLAVRPRLSQRFERNARIDGSKPASLRKRLRKFFTKVELRFFVAVQSVQIRSACGWNPAPLVYAHLATGPVHATVKVGGTCFLPITVRSMWPSP